MAHNGTEPGRRSAAGSALALLALLLGCSDEGELPSADAGAVASATAEDSGALNGLDAASADGHAASGNVDGRDARAQSDLDGAVAGDAAPAAKLDAGDGATREAARDAATDAWALALESCAQERALLDQRRSCNTHQDCVMAGSCSGRGGYGFYAVQLSAKDEAERILDNTRCPPAADGPMYEAVCEQGSCRKRPSGAWCGGAPAPDGGPMGCAPGEAQYRTDCESASAATGKPTCERGCNGAADTSCGAGRVCTSVRVSEGLSGYGTSCDALVDVWLCRAAR